MQFQKRIKSLCVVEKRIKILIGRGTTIRITTIRITEFLVAEAGVKIQFLTILVFVFAGMKVRRPKHECCGKNM